MSKCPEPCATLLDCGHQCKSRCHGDRSHPPCTYPCERTGKQCRPPRVCSHTCDKKCGTSCGACTVTVAYTYDDCGHTVELRCHQLENIPPCTVLCKLEASCQHFVNASCLQHKNGTAHKLCREKCGKPTDCYCDSGRCKRKCGHGGSCDCMQRAVIELPCGHLSPGFGCTTEKPPPCTAACEKTLYCGHRCSGCCGICEERKFHAHCMDGKRTLMCGHVGRMGCSDTTGFCKEPCKFSCGHGEGCADLPKRERHVCGQCPSRRCQEPCVWNCPHGGCNKMCWEPCEFVPRDEEAHGQGCWKRCQEKLPCGHQCCGLCGERCPTFCWECYASNSGEMVSLRERVETFVYERDEVCTGVPQSEGDEPPYLVEMRCCRKFIPARELYSCLESASNQEVRVHTCPLCRAAIIPNSFRHGGRLLKQRLDDVHTVLKRVREGVVQSRDASVKHAQDVVDHLSANDHGIPVKRFQSIINNTRMLLSQGQLRFKPAKQAPGLDYTNILASFKGKCSKLSVGDGWIGLLSYYLNVTEYVLCNLQREKETWENAHKLAHAAFTVVKLIESGVSISNDGGIYAEVRRFCWNNLRDMVPDVSCLARSLPSAEATQEVNEFLQRAEWTDILCALPESVTLEEIPSQDIEEAKRFAQKGVRPGEEARAKSLEGRLKNIVTVDTLKNVASIIGLTGGHWYKCPNGHFYVVGECGNPAVSGRCPECGEGIGGVNYVSHRGNTHVGVFR
ncbi:unnamed protein product [Trypanosoma congolense IL3000]|uniref:WGS project CAEQ00000000 data, annotated contig 2449 n=1 Tax=Trypanosoma congolense (strain IL3000) TaxID=1068625 RepID=F9WE98_TRYCI|nr:unnamed protein product [Trypanosoma congolense IL3000]